MDRRRIGQNRSQGEEKNWTNIGLKMPQALASYEDATNMRLVKYHLKVRATLASGFGTVCRSRTHFYEHILQ